MTDILFHNLQERLDRIEQKLDGKIRKPWLTMADVVFETGLSISTIKRAIKNGNLRVSGNKGRNLFRREWIDLWLKG